MDTKQVTIEQTTYPLNERMQTIIISGIEYPLQDAVWGLMLQLSWERDYYRDGAGKQERQ